MLLPITLCSAFIYALPHPEQVHVNLGVANSLVVTFVTVGTNDTLDSFVAIHSTQKGTPTVVKAVTSTYTAGDWTGLIHRASLGSLTLGSTYTYRCGVGSTGAKQHWTEWFEVDWFAKDFAGGRPVVLAMVADLDGRDADGVSTIAALAAATRAGTIDAVLHAGDIAYVKGADKESIYDEFFRTPRERSNPSACDQHTNPSELHLHACCTLPCSCAKKQDGTRLVSTVPSMQIHARLASPRFTDRHAGQLEPVASRIPYHVAVGNQEHWNDFAGYNNRFAMPGQASRTMRNFWHSVDFGPVHALFLSTEHPFDAGSLQHTFAAADLAAVSRATTPWVVVVLHRPLYCSTNDYYDCHMAGPQHLRPALEGLFVAYGVDAVVAGHVHNYERTAPVINGSILRGSAPVHVTVGNAGDIEGPTRGWSSTRPSWSVARSLEVGWGRWTASRTMLRLEMLSSANGATLDMVELTK